MFIPVEQRPETPSLDVASVTVVATRTEVATRPEPAEESPKIMEEVLIEEVSIDGMCGVY